MRKTKAQLQAIINEMEIERKDLFNIKFSMQRKIDQLKLDYEYLQKTMEATMIMKAHCDGMIKVYERFAKHDIGIGIGIDHAELLNK